MSAVPLDIPGNDLNGIQYGVDFMKKANLGEEVEVGTDVVIIGGGYTAMDCSRTSLRHGAQNVTIAYRRTRSELVVDEEELGETEREGVTMDFLVSPIELIGDENGNISGVKFVRNKLGEPDATGRRRPVPIEGTRVRRPGTDGHPGRQPGRRQHLPAGRASFEINRGRMRVDPGTYATNVRGVFACGDFVTGPDHAHRGRRPRQEVRLRHRPLPVGSLHRRGRRQRPHRQLLAPRHARALRRAAAPAHPGRAGRGAHALGRPHASTSARRWSSATASTAP